VTYYQIIKRRVYNISIHTVLADCDLEKRRIFHLSVISIHTVLADCDSTFLAIRYFMVKFQSTQSSQTVTMSRQCPEKIFRISIHTVLADCDDRKLQDLLHAVISIHTVLADCDLRV